MDTVDRDNIETGANISDQMFFFLFLNDVFRSIDDTNIQNYYLILPIIYYYVKYIIDIVSCITFIQQILRIDDILQYILFFNACKIYKGGPSQ